MSFKARKLNIDLTLDFTEYIPEKDGGILTTEKTDAETLNKWLDMAIEEGSKLEILREAMKNKDENALSLSEISKEAKSSILKQIDFFYSKGHKFYEKIPMSVINDALKYVNTQISPVKKK